MRKKDSKKVLEECRKLNSYIEDLLNEIKTENSRLKDELEFLHAEIKNKNLNQRNFEDYVGDFFDLLPSHASENLSLERLSEEKTKIRREVGDLIKQNGINEERLEKLLNYYYSPKRDLLNSIALLELALPIYTSMRVKGYSHKELAGLDFPKSVSFKF